jgi:hypothetical protein
MPKLKPEHVAEIVAERLGQAFSCSQFINLFEDHELSSGWTLGDALAAQFFQDAVMRDCLTDHGWKETLRDAC